MTPTALAGKAVVITGAGRGIGAACAVHAAAHGASVVVNDIDDSAAEAVVDEIRETGGRAVAVAADVSSWTGAEGLISSCVAEFGRVDGLVNNAAILRMDRLVDQTEADLRATIDVNIFGVVACSTFAVRRMVEQGSGSVVNISSGAQSGIVSQGAYSASKGAVSALTYTWAMEFAGSGIRVNAISPRAATRMADHAKDYRIRIGIDPLHDSPAPDPSANAPIVTYLLSDLSTRVNGQIIRVNDTMLALYTHPAVLLPTQRRDNWTVADVDEVFQTDLADRQIPLGIMAVEVGIYKPDPFSRTRT